MIIPIKSKGEIYNVLIDEEDFDKVSEFNWCIQHQTHTKYCITNIYYDGEGKWTGLQLHRFLMGLENGDKRMINHKDGNGLNNMRSNLEICDNKYNTQSINTKKNFGYIYVEKDRLKKYRASVTINKKLYCKRFYTNEESQAYLDGLQEVAEAETIPLT